MAGSIFLTALILGVVCWFILNFFTNQSFRMPDGKVITPEGDNWATYVGGIGLLVCFIVMIGSGIWWIWS